jgi:hypothetical protein
VAHRDLASRIHVHNAADCVAKLFSGPRRQRSIQNSDPNRNIDSKMRADGFDYFKFQFHRLRLATFATQSPESGQTRTDTNDPKLTSSGSWKIEQVFVLAPERGKPIMRRREFIALLGSAAAGRARGDRRYGDAGDWARPQRVAWWVRAPYCCIPSKPLVSRGRTRATRSKSREQIQRGSGCYQRQRDGRASSSEW